MRTFGILSLCGLTIFLGACSSGSPAVDKVAIEKSVQAVEAGMVKAAAAKDVAAFVSNYAPDAVMMTPGEPAMRGQDAIKAGLTGMFADPAMKLDFASDKVDVADSGDLAVTSGAYTLAVTDPVAKKPVADKGGYVTVFRKQKDGAWKVTLDIATSEVPPVAPPAPKAEKKAAPAKKKGKKR